ncbi:MAG: methyltransferase domain-containing protein, partial [Acidobacteria bacterium]|nr:methyltransferase domain-containing protein [Acidobacteriota bacterium]
MSLRPPRRLAAFPLPQNGSRRPPPTVKPWLSVAGDDRTLPYNRSMANRESTILHRHPLADGAAPRRRGGGLPWPVARALGSFAGGRLDVIEGASRHTFGEPGSAPLAARVEIHDRRTWRALLLGGTIGAAEAYAEGWWSADDLTSLIRLVVRNERAAAGLDGRLSRAALALHTALHRLRGNRRLQSRRNVSAHYDLGNDFFAHFLDSSMTYSCAVFPSRACTLEEASRHKLDLICRRLNLSPADDLLEIGTGWGSLALHAASRYGCRVTTTTISAEQYRHARAAVSRAGLEGRVTVLDADYRDLPRVVRRRFDKLVSVEMIEAV